MNPSLVSTEEGAVRDTVCLTTETVRRTEIARAADAVGRATARHDALDPTTPARTGPEKRPVESVTTDATVDHVVPYRCSHTVRPASTGATTPDRTTDSAGALTEGLALSDTVEATSASAGATATNGDTIANTTPNSNSNRRPRAPCQRTRLMTHP